MPSEPIDAASDAASDAPRPVRLLHVFPSFEVGGSQMRTTRLMNAFETLGERFEHHVLPLDGRADAAGRVAPEVSFALVDPPPKAGSLQTARALRAVLRRLRPGLVLTYNWGAIDAILAAALPGGAPVVHHEDGFSREEAAGPLPRRSLARRALFRTVQRVLVPSERLSTLSRERWGTPEPKLVLIPNGIDLERFRPPAPGEARELRAALGLPPDGPLLGSVGSLRPEKHLERLIAAFEQVESPAGARLAIVGDGVRRADLEARVAASPAADRIHFLGLLADPSEAQRAFDAFALTSDTEQMPLALVEAMASGKPAVTTDVGDVRQILPAEQAALIVPLGRPEEQIVTELARALGQVLGDASEAAALGAANRARAEERYAEEGMVRRYAELYRAAARAPRA